MNDRLSLLTTNISTEQLNKVLIERDQYINQLNKIKNELPELKQQMIESFQTKVLTFKEQVKKSLLEKENDYRKKIKQIENEYIEQYQQVLEKNKQIVRALIASKQEEFNTEKVMRYSNVKIFYLLFLFRLILSRNMKKNSRHFKNNR